ncbi:hypothetical protein ABZY19_29020 [Streptomyces sp. NPDC006475]|uniref:hypothetical protein n=1 Tax=Streptomyces sp. NPDC006475 TaxID=3155719 RepID=UPI0033A513F2
MSSPIKPTAPTEIDSYADPLRQRRYIAAMKRIATVRRPGPVRVYLSVAPRMRQAPAWDARLADIRRHLPGVELLEYLDVFNDVHPYDWSQVAGTLDGLIIVAKAKRIGSNSHILGPYARGELRSLVAHKPVLLHTYRHGLVPIIDCSSGLIGPEEKRKLRLTAPNCWKPDSPTLEAALAALAPADSAAVAEPMELVRS